MSLRPYQAELRDRIYHSWGCDNRNVLAVSPTGSGKTRLFSHIINDYRGSSVAIAHRQELVGQISVALARDGIRHRLIAPAPVIRRIVGSHMEEFGRSYFDPSARTAAAGVDTLIGLNPNEPIFHQTGLWVCDEAHHLLRTNKWGRAVAMFPHAHGLGVTATALRASGEGLGAHADGVFHDMVTGPSMRQLINDGYLTDYRVFTVLSDIDLSDVPISNASGDFSPPKLRAAVHKSKIVGDIVRHYTTHAMGKRGVCFAVDIEHATEIAASFRTAGVAAEVVTGKTPDALRAHILRKLRTGEIQMVVNVDLFGEGFDLPAIEVVILARPTMSYGLYVQMFGRALRIMDGKKWALIFDHVGNVVRHGLPDRRRAFTMDRRERRSRATPNDVIPVRTCLNPTCGQTYERTYAACPYCSHVPEIAQRGAPQFVDGDLGELDPAILAKMRGEIEAVDHAPAVPYGASPEIRGAIQKRHFNRQEAQRDLRATIALWAGYQRDQGYNDSQSYRLFFFMFGTDVGTAQTLPRAEAQALNDRISKYLSDLGVISHETIEHP